NALNDSIASTNAPDPADRRRILRELAELNPSDLEHRLELARYELALGDAAAAIKASEELLRERPGWSAAQYMKLHAGRVEAGLEKVAPLTPPDGAKEGEGG